MKKLYTLYICRCLYCLDFQVIKKKKNPLDSMSAPTTMSKSLSFRVWTVIAIGLQPCLSIVDPSQNSKGIFLSPKSGHIILMFKMYQGFFVFNQEKKIKVPVHFSKTLCDLVPAYHSDLISHQYLPCPLFSIF